MIKIKRVYEEPNKDDGFRVLIDRLWPRGVSKAKARVDEWLKDIAPSDALRHWFAHDPAKWDEFRARYKDEILGNAELLKDLKGLEARHKTITLLFAAKDKEHNNAVVLAKIASGKKKR